MYMPKNKKRTYLCYLPIHELSRLTEMGFHPLRINWTVQKLWILQKSGPWDMEMKATWVVPAVPWHSTVVTFVHIHIDHASPFAQNLQFMRYATIWAFCLLRFTLLPFIIDSNLFSVNTHFLTPPSFLSLNFSSFMSPVINVSHCRHLSVDTLTGALTYTKCAPLPTPPFPVISHHSGIW